MPLLARPVLLDPKVPRAPRARLVTPVLRTSKVLRPVRLVRQARQASVTSRHTWQAGAAPVVPVPVPDQALARSVACRTHLRAGSRPGKNSLPWDTVRGTPMVSNLVLAVPRALPVLKALQVLQVDRVRQALLDKAGSRRTSPPTIRDRHKSRRRSGLPPTGSP
jgi:hypothetical protein